MTLFLVTTVHAQARSSFDLPAQSLATSLRAVASQTGTNVLFDPPLVEGRVAPALKAQLTLDQAFTKLLAGTGLKYRFLDDKTIMVISASESQSATAGHTSANTDTPVVSGLPVLVAQTNPTASSTNNSATKENQSLPDKESKSSSSPEVVKSGLEEIVVTGTNIRGNADTASPLRTYSRADIDQSGVGTVQEFVQRLTQNFNGGAAENTAFSGGGGQASQVSNFTNGSAINLRGLGNTSTLVLIDGHRIAAGNFGGEFVDISMIPLTAVERVEVLTDGASAIYGSDAVGGVVNFIMRKSLDGFETRARFGEVSNGGTRETQLGQTAGHDWDTGSALLSYEFYDRTPLSAGDRSYANTVTEPFNLLPEQVRNSVFATLNQRLGENVKIYAQGNYSRRASENFFSFFSTTQKYPSTSSAFGGTFGALISLPHDLEMDVGTTYGASDVHVQRFLRGTQAPAIDITSRSDVSSVDAKVDGTVYTTPQGKIRFALGAQFRHEAFDTTDHVVDSSFFPRRSIRAEFAELDVPVVGPAAVGSPVDRLALTLAARQEHYSDFGSTSNPQIGMVWNPTADVKLRGTFGTSFRAPILSDLNPVPNSVVPFPEPDPGIGTKSCFPFSATNSCTDVLVVNGGNPGLTAEKATTWTAGLDLNPRAIPGLKIGATYYNIRFKNEIGLPNPSSDTLLNVFAYQSVLGPKILQRNPPASLVQSYAASPTYFDAFGIGTSSIGALYDDRFQNISIVSTSGIDLSLSLSRQLGSIQVLESIDATRILRFDNQFTPTSPAVSLLNTPYNPPRLRIRGQSGMTAGPISMAVFINYVGSYSDNLVDPIVPVASWTTVDATATYAFRGNGLLEKTRLAIGIINIANKNPPFLLNSQASIPVNYDASNASPLGRFLSIELSKQW